MKPASLSPLRRCQTAGRRNTVVLALSLAAAFPALADEPAPASQTAAPEAAARFDIWEFRVDGNSVLDHKLIERTVYPFLGPGRSIDDVEKARTALEKVYQDAGYATVLVDIPEQGVEEGIVLLKVTEGTVERLKVTGSRYFAQGKIREKVAQLAPGSVPHMPTLQAELAGVAGLSPDRSVTPVLRAGRTPGTLDAELQVKDSLPLHGGVEMNSRNAEGTTRTRLIASLRYDNLWQANHSVALQYQVSPENADEVEIWSGTYGMPAGFWDARLNFNAVGVASNTGGAAVGGVGNVIGDTDTYSLGLNVPLGTIGGTLFHSASLSFQYRDSQNSVGFGGTAAAQSTPVTYTAFVLGYALSHQGETRLSALDLGLHFAFRGLGNDAEEFSARRIGAKPDFVYLTGNLSHQEVLPFDLRLLARFSGQIANGPLISQEQFSAGGPLSVRGYHQTQALEDSGLSGSVELHSPTLWKAEALNDFRALIFAEGAKLWRIDPLPGEPRNTRLASFGAGLRLKLFKHYFGEVDWAYPLYGIGSVSRGEQRVDFRVGYDF